MEQDRTYRGKLVEVIVNSFISDSENKYVNERFGEELQKVLNSNLKFETKVFDVKTINEYGTGNVSFKDEENIDRAVNFTVYRTKVNENV